MVETCDEQRMLRLINWLKLCYCEHRQIGLNFEVKILFEMEVHGINLDVMTNQPVIILKDIQSNRYLPIWIGQFEATAILMEVQGIHPSRPLTHDLLKTIVDTLNVQVTHVVINDLKEGTFYAQIHMSINSSQMQIDARPSDAIALAVRSKAPIFADENVLEQAAVFSEPGEEEEVERFREFLENVRPDDFREDT
jgi:bifunctional DNase/RNase